MTKRQKHRIHDVIIAGGGIAGVTLAVLLAQAGADVALIDPGTLRPAPAPAEPGGRTVALMQTSLSILAAAGVWPGLEPQAAALAAMRMMDVSLPRAKPQESVFYAEELGLAQFGYNIPNHLLHNALLARAQKTKGLHLHPGMRVSDLETQTTQAVVKISGEKGKQTALRARLVVGAEGRNSVIREKCGIQLSRHDYDQAAITCVVRHATAHENTATEFHRPAGPLAMVPLPGDCSSVVWVEKREDAREMLRLRKEDFEDRLRHLTLGRLGPLKLMGRVESWPLGCMVAQSLSANRVAMIAETVHVMSPITAQGLNLSLRDVATLAETVVDALRLGLDPGAASVTDEYAGRRALDIKTRTMGVDGFNRLVAQEISMINGMRRGALRVIGKVTPLRRFAMRQGLAPVLDAGRLMQGGSL